LKDLKCGDEEGWRLVRLICDKEVVQRVTKERNIIRTTKRRKIKLIRHILSRNCLLKQVTYGKGWEDEQQDVRNYWMALRKEGTGI